MKAISIDYRYTDYHIHHGFTLETVVHALESTGINIGEAIMYNSMRLKPTGWFLENVLRKKFEFSMISMKKLK